MQAIHHAQGNLIAFFIAVQFVHHHQAVTIHCHSEVEGTWYQFAHGHCLATFVFVTSHQLSNNDAAHSLVHVEQSHFTNKFVSVLAFSQVIVVIRFVCVVEFDCKNHLFLHH